MSRFQMKNSRLSTALRYFSFIFISKFDAQLVGFKIRCDECQHTISSMPKIAGEHY